MKALSIDEMINAELERGERIEAFKDESTIHLGKKPRRGGTPANDMNASTRVFFSFTSWFIFSFIEFLRICTIDREIREYKIKYTIEIDLPRNMADRIQPV